MKTMKTMRQLGFLACSLLTLAACSSGNSSDPLPSTGQESQKLPININTSVDTRVIDNSFEKGDNIGLFVVNYNADGSAGTLNATGNHVNNMKYTYNGTWTPASPTYWKDNTTHADFYLYYPYTGSIGDVNAMPWNVNADQSTSAKYKSADLLIGKTTNVAPTETAVKIDAKHVMSQMVVSLKPGNGFTEESLGKAKISVKINRLKTQGTANLVTGKLTAKGNDADLTPLKEEGYNYKALIIPQSVGEGKLITVNVDGRDYQLKKAANFTAFEAGKKHKFTVTLSKTSNGVNVNITKWEDDGIDYGGTAE